VFEAKLGDTAACHFAWNGVAVELGVRRCSTTPVLARERYPNQRPVRPLTGSGRTGFGERSPPRDE
jgi:hypothetical protein